MRIVVLGANGQVGAEVCEILARAPDIDLVPVSRTRNGSAYLRSRGVAVWHGDPVKAAQASAMFAGADLIANFALAGGVGKVARLANEEIIAATLQFSPAKAKHIFFSTLAVHGVWDEEGGQTGNQYGDLKRSNEAFFAKQLERNQRAGWTLRLGHVCGSEQGLSHALRKEIQRGPVFLPDPERASNTIYTQTICDAIIAIAKGQTSPPGRFDLVNAPQWSWRQVYQYEAGIIGSTVQIESAPRQPVTHRRSIKALAFALITRLGVRAKLERALPMLPAQFAEQIRADFMVSRTAGEIAALTSSPKIANLAACWPALETLPLAQLNPTATYSQSPSNSLPGEWATSLETR
ncbi:MAG: hypothetical protein RL367_488 [Pseudomonadota bacterium]